MTLSELIRELECGKVLVSDVTGKAYALVVLDERGCPMCGAHMTEAEAGGNFTLDTVRDLIINLDEDAM